MSGDPRPTPAMLEAVARLAAGPAVARPYGQRYMIGCERFVAEGGAVIDTATLRGLSRRGLARQLLHPSRFVITQAGLRLFANLERTADAA